MGKLTGDYMGIYLMFSAALTLQTRRKESAQGLAMCF